MTYKSEPVVDQPIHFTVLLNSDDFIDDDWTIRTPRFFLDKLSMAGIYLITINYANNHLEWNFHDIYNTKKNITIKNEIVTFATLQCKHLFFENGKPAEFLGAFYSKFQTFSKEVELCFWLEQALCQAQYYYLYSFCNLTRHNKQNLFWS